MPILSSSVNLQCDNCLEWFLYKFIRGCLSSNGTISLSCPNCKSKIQIVDKGKISEDIYDLQIQGAKRGLHLVFAGS